MENACLNCNTTLKSGVFSSVLAFSEGQTKLINLINETSTPGHCTKCGTDLLTKARQQAFAELESINKHLQKLIHAIPVISLQNPLNWDYQVKWLVTGQSTTGTGVFSEFTSSFTDLFGVQSGRYNSKIKAGELLCQTQIRTQAIRAGANAVIGVDIDYAEVGGDKGMLMVCMTGTAVRIKNLSEYLTKPT